MTVYDIYSQYKAINMSSNQKITVSPSDYAIASSDIAKIDNGLDGISYNNRTILTANSRNNVWSSRGYTEPPYKANTPVVGFNVTQNTQYVRVYDKINANQNGSWIMRASDIQGLTPQQIQSKYALSYTPRYISDVIVPSGSQVYLGIAESNFNQPGGGIQFDLDWANKAS